MGFPPPSFSFSSPSLPPTLLKGEGEGRKREREREDPHFPTPPTEPQQLDRLRGFTRAASPPARGDGRVWLRLHLAFCAQRNLRRGRTNRDGAYKRWNPRKGSVFFLPFFFFLNLAGGWAEKPRTHEKRALPHGTSCATMNATESRSTEDICAESRRRMVSYQPSGIDAGAEATAASRATRRTWDAFPVTPLPNPQLHADREAFAGAPFSKASLYVWDAFGCRASCRLMLHSRTPWRSMDRRKRLEETRTFLHVLIFSLFSKVRNFHKYSSFSSELAN